MDLRTTFNILWPLITLWLGYKIGTGSLSVDALLLKFWPRCAFCGRSFDRADKTGDASEILINGEHAGICSRCVADCVTSLTKHGKGITP